MEGVGFGAADLSEIPLQQIDHIEIVRGGLVLALRSQRHGRRHQCDFQTRRLYRLSHQPCQL